ncbi:RHS repeat-associated core domain-containing protein [Desulfobacula sp.]|uniref:RHS repeat-associated core domain-containing protein n=1 Tax=Desulfobacula sp. TaxID=2593537 RepID=UPI00260443A6|nr:RHS repeat-associated core domain-containing protein [Desulfobacula sp.]
MRSLAAVRQPSHRPITGGSHEGPYTLDTYEITVLDGIVADFESQGIGCVEDETEFINKSCGGNTFKWVFGDGSMSSQKNPVHIYDTEGTYTVSLTAYGPVGHDTKTKTITITSECATVIGYCEFAPTGATLPGVEISGYSSSLSKDTGAVSSASGHYKMVVAANETYGLYAKRPGFISQIGPAVNLKPKEVTTWNVAMQPEVPEMIHPSSLNGEQFNNVIDPVNPATGNYYFSQGLFRFPGVRKIHFNFQAAYNSSAAMENGPLGYGWTHSYHIYLVQQGDDITVHFSDGHKEFFRLISGTDNYKAFNCHPSIDLVRISPEGWTANAGGGLYWAFDGQGRLARIFDLNNNAIVFEHSTQLDNITDTQGRRIELSYTDGRITSITSPSAIVTDTTQGYTYDSVNRILTQAGGTNTVTYAFDVNGNLIKKTAGTAVTTYTYDVFNRLLSVANGTDTTAYAYNAAGKRVAKTHNGNEIRYQRVDDAVLAVSDSNDQLTSYHIYADALLYSLDENNAIRVYHADPRGSVVAVTDATQKTIQTYAYGPYGKVTAGGGTIKNPFQYVGIWGVLADENGLSHMQARYYDAGMGRFLTEDPLGTLSGANVYAYVGADPINKIDPSGLLDETAVADISDFSAESGSNPLGYSEKPTTTFEIDPRTSEITDHEDPMKKDKTYRNELIKSYEQTDPEKAKELEKIFGEYDNLKDFVAPGFFDPLIRSGNKNNPNCEGCTRALTGIQRSPEDYKPTLSGLQHFEMVHIGIGVQDYGGGNTFKHHSTGIVDKSTGKVIAVLDPIPMTKLLGIPIPGGGQQTDFLGSTQIYDFEGGVMSPNDWVITRTRANLFDTSYGVGVVPLE